MLVPFPPPVGRPHPFRHCSREQMKLVAKTRAEEWMRTRLADLTPKSFSDNELPIFSTSAIEPPAAFQHLWHHLNVQNGVVRLRPRELRVIREAPVLLLFCDTRSTDDMNNAKAFAVRLAVLRGRTPIIFLVAHSVAPEFRRDDPIPTSADIRALSEAFSAGVSDIIYGEYCGRKLACHVRSKIAHRTRNEQFAIEQIRSKRDTAERAQFLSYALEDTLWNYLRVRLDADLPAADDNLGPGEPAVLSNFLVGDAFRQGRFTKMRRLVNPVQQNESTGQVVKVIAKQPIKSFNTVVSLSDQLRARRTLNARPHQNIVRLFQAYHADDCVLLRMEDAGPMNLHERLALRDQSRKALDVKKVKQIFSGLMAGVCHMHSVAKVPHRDIKLENVFVSETKYALNVKIADFDVQPPSTFSKHVTGTFPYMAPEMLLTENFDHIPADIWSMAIVLLEVVCGLSTLQKHLGLEHCRKGAGAVEKNDTMKRSMKRIHSFFAEAGNCDALVQNNIHDGLCDMIVDSQDIFNGTLNVLVEQRWSAKTIKANYGGKFDL